MRTHENFPASQTKATSATHSSSLGPVSNSLPPHTVAAADQLYVTMNQFAFLRIFYKGNPKLCMRLKTGCLATFMQKFLKIKTIEKILELLKNKLEHIIHDWDMEEGGKSWGSRYHSGSGPESTVSKYAIVTSTLPKSSLI